MSIKQLPQGAIEKLRSTVAITSLDGVICSLLKNSLDASASKIHVAIDVAKGNCSVEDNGHGITPTEFHDDGGLGKTHYTSKYPATSTVHGRRGDFLAALASLALVHIMSKHIDHESHNALLLHQGTVLSRRCPAPEEHRLTTFEHGTRVVVRDLFGNLPVRVKQRAIAGSKAASQNKLWPELIQRILALLLSWPSAVVIIVRDTAADRELRLQAPTARTSLTSRTSALLGQAALSEHEDTDSWIPASSSSRQVSVSGCFSLRGSPSRRSQFLSFGIHPADNTNGYNILYEEINKTFKASDFGCASEVTAPAKPWRKLGDWQNRRSPDKHPMFYLRIDVGAADTEQLSEDSLYAAEPGILEVILDLLRAVSFGFLKRHHFRPRKLEKTSLGSPKLSTRRSAKLSRRSEGHREVPLTARSGTTSPQVMERPASPFNGWNRVKVGLASNSRKEPKAVSLRKERLIGADGSVLRRPFQELPPRAEEAQRSSERLLSRQAVGSLSEPQDRNNDAEVDTRIPSTVTYNSKALQEPRSKWLAEVVKGWKNPGFECAGQDMPSVSPGQLHTSSQHSHHWAGSLNEATLLDSSSVGTRQKLCKDALLGAEIINQLDNKFILVRLPSVTSGIGERPAANTLVVLDQHAVDERCRLEDLMADYFRRDSAGSAIANTESLEKPIGIELTVQETQLLQQYNDWFLSWGIVYSLYPSHSGNTATGRDCTVVVRSLPPSIIERCRTETKLLMDIIRQEIWHLYDTGGMPSQIRIWADPTSATSAHPWVGLFRGCPRGILDLLHSRSCRSAIMFNDPLTKDECARLIERLSRCAFPFQCAHGRPSMAPILELGMEPRLNAWTGEDDVNVRKAKWNQWMEA